MIDIEKSVTLVLDGLESADFRAVAFWIASDLLLRVEVRKHSPTLESGL